MRTAVDPGLIALHAATSPEQIDDHVRVATEWLAAHLDERATLLVSDEVMELLAECGLLPLRHSLEDLFRTHAITWLTPFDVSRTLLEILERADRFESEIVAATGLDAHLDPRSVPEGCGCHNEVDQLLKRTWALSGALESFRTSKAPDVMVSAGAQAPPRLSGRYFADELMFADETIEQDVEGAFHIATVSSMSDASTECDPVDLALRSMARQESTKSAIVAAAKQYLSRSIQIEFSTHAQWGNDLCDHTLAKNHGLFVKTLRAAAEIVTASDQRKSHALRKSAAPGSDQVRVGAWSAWRHDIDSEFHIHYWRGTGGAVQLCTARSHNDFWIPQPE